MSWTDRIRQWLSQGALPSEFSQEWLLQAWAWLLQHAPQPGQLRHAALLPLGPSLLPADPEPERARQALEIILEHAGMASWRCRLQAQPRSTTEQLREEGVYLQGGSADPWGTFSEDHRGPLITYAPEICGSTTVLLSVLAHEVGHLRLSRAGARRPWERATEEPLTDLVAIAMGFGLYTVDTAVVLFSDGSGPFRSQSVGTSGYLSERERAFALAIFTEVQQRDPDDIARQLTANPRRAYRAAITRLRTAHAEAIAQLRAMHTGPDLGALLET